MSIKIIFEPRDIWVGVFWKIDKFQYENNIRAHQWRVYICLIPCFPIQIMWIVGYVKDKITGEWKEAKK